LRKDETVSAVAFLLVFAVGIWFLLAFLGYL